MVTLIYYSNETLTKHVLISQSTIIFSNHRAGIKPTMNYLYVTNEQNYQISALKQAVYRTQL